MTDVEEDTSVYLRDLPIAPPPRGGRRLGRSTAVLLLALAIGSGFLAGVKVQKHQGGSSGTSALAAAFANRARGTTGTGTGNAARTGTGGFGGATIGTVKLIDGDNIYVTTTSGDIVKVKTTGSSTITKSSPAKASDVQPGDTVVVQGQAGTDGTVTATRVTDNGAGGTGGGFGGGGFSGGGFSGGGPPAG